MIYGLIGKNLSHSFSDIIHKMFGNKNYELKNYNNVDNIFDDKDIKGFNITIPYKTSIIPHLKGMDEIAKATKSVNTVIRGEDGFYGYNTDYYGFVETLKFYSVTVESKNVLILGNGSVSKTVLKALSDFGAKKVKRLCRNIKSDSDILFADFIEQKDYQIIVNTTPVGTYPNNEDNLLIDLNQYESLECIIDLIYNPLRTKLLIAAEEMGLKAINGLYMLIMQAKKANEIFFNKSIPLNKGNQVHFKLRKKLYNLVFVGLPLCGKSKYANLLGKKLNKEIVDTDYAIENASNMKIPDIFANYGESYFRNLESKSVDNIYKNFNQCISTGGGIIKNLDNVKKLKQNGIIIFLDKDPEKIASKTILGRPLIQSKEDIYRLASERLPIYNKAADITIKIYKDTDTHLNDIKEKYYEYIGR